MPTHGRPMSNKPLTMKSEYKGLLRPYTLLLNLPWLVLPATSSVIQASPSCDFYVFIEASPSSRVCLVLNRIYHKVVLGEFINTGEPKTLIKVFSSAPVAVFVICFTVQPRPDVLGLGVFAKCSYSF